MKRLKNRMAQDGERGSVTVWLAITTFGFLLAFGLAVDLVGADRVGHRADTVAQEAARAAGQELQDTTAARGQGASMNTARAQSAGQQYLAAAGVSGTVSVQSGTTVVVTTRDTYSTKVLSIIGISSVSVTGEGTSRVVRAVDGSEQ